MSQVFSWSVRGALVATGIIGALTVAACGGDDGTTPAASSSSSSSGSVVTPQGPCNGKPVNDCGGCSDLPAKVGTTCAAGYNVCKGSDSTECKAGDGPPVTALTATTNLEDKVTLTWTAPTTLTPSGYIISRDGAEYGSAGIARFDDSAAEAAKVVGPSNVQASDGTASDKVTVTWTAGSSAAGKSYKYTVTPLYAQSGSTLKGLASNEATGNRAAPAIAGYEVQRDDGQWVAAGTGTSYDDKDAPIGALISGEPESELVSRGPSAIAFRVSLNGTPTFGDVAPSTYKVRAKVASSTIDAATSDTGFKKKPTFDSATATVKWQRSSADGDFGYVDLPGQTFSAGVDLAGPTDGSSRFYRPVVTFGGATLNVPGRRSAGSSAFKSTQLFWDNGCGVRLDDTVKCWGANNNNVITATPAALKAKKVAMGGNHACAIKLDDTAVCWGFTGDNRSTAPAGVIKDVAVSADSSCFIKADDTLQCSVNVATPPTGAHKRVYRGTNNTYCATKADDTTVCWGNNGSNIVSNTAAYAAVKFKTLAGGNDHFCGITEADKITCWGANDGAPFFSSRLAAVAPAVTADTYKSLSVGVDNTCATRSDDTLECWGPGFENHFVGRSSLKFKSLAHGNRMACGVDMNDRFLCEQSRNFQGAGPNEVAPQLPIKIKSLGQMGRSNVPCVITDNDRVRCFGNTSFDTDRIRGASPADSFKTVEAGLDIACGLRLDDTLACWGNRGSAPLSGAIKYSHMSVSWNRGGVCAVRQDNGAIECFGGASSPPAGTGYKKVAVTRGYICAINAADAIACTNYDTRYGAPAAPPAGAYKAIFPQRRTGNAFCALDTNDKRICWGRVGSAQTTLSTDAYTNVTSQRDAICGTLSSGYRKCEGVPIGSLGTGIGLDKVTNTAFSRDARPCTHRADGTFYCDGDAVMPRFF